MKDLTTAAGNLPDIAMVDNPKVSTLADAGLLTTTDDNGFDVSNIEENILSAGEIDGKYYGVPVGANTLGLYYNPALLEAAGVDIASMSPQERANRLFDRIMRLSEEGKRDSVELFASMAIPVYESLGPLDLDARYDLGRIAQVSAQLELAQAQADTILQQSPDHLLGLVLAIAIAGQQSNQSRLATLERRLLAAETGQLARDLPEYTRHRSDIDAALAAARRQP